MLRRPQPSLCNQELKGPEERHTKRVSLRLDSAHATLLIRHEIIPALPLDDMEAIDYTDTGSVVHASVHDATG